VREREKKKKKKKIEQEGGGKAMTGTEKGGWEDWWKTRGKWAWVSWGDHQSLLVSSLNATSLS